MTTVPQADTTMTGDPREIQVTVDYLPAAAPFQHRYPPETTVETVRVAAMKFFGVQDRQDRDTYRYFLEISGTRITDTSQPISNFIEHGREHHFHLVEQITPGSAW
jgi:hypothetical protein